MGDSNNVAVMLVFNEEMAIGSTDRTVEVVRIAGACVIRFPKHEEGT